MHVIGEHMAPTTHKASKDATAASVSAAKPRRKEMTRAQSALFESGTRRYGVIYADPPWQTVTWGPPGRDRCPDGVRLLATGGYPTITLAQLMALPVAGCCAPDCRLFLWTTDAHLPQALELGPAWGFCLQHGRLCLGKADLHRQRLAVRRR